MFATLHVMEMSQPLTFEDYLLAWENAHNMLKKAGYKSVNTAWSNLVVK